MTDDQSASSLDMDRTEKQLPTVLLLGDIAIRTEDTVPVARATIVTLMSCLPYRSLAKALSSVTMPQYYSILDYDIV
jgi:hypothetical protein